MTERLYYDQTYLKEFDASVTQLKEENGGCWAALDRSAFYPTSGGQPHDTGVIESASGCVRVTDVETDAEGEVWHRVEGSLTVGDTVHGCIDWERRFDHMQQHGGEHMLAGAVYTLFGGMTIGLHLGAEDSTIDVTMPDGSTRFTDEMIPALEENVNRHIQEDAHVHCWFPTDEELKALPLRKPPTVSEHVRIVAFGDYEMVACGGTHPSSAGQIGLMKILSVTPSRGKARIRFVCGMRAFRYVSLCARAAEEAGKMLSSSPDKLTGAVLEMKERLSNTEKQLRDERANACLSLLEKQEGMLYLEQGDPKALQEAVSRYILSPGRCAVTGAGHRLIFARSADVSADMAQLLRSVARGGGRPDMASGDGDREAVLRAQQLLKEM